MSIEAAFALVVVSLFGAGLIVARHSDLWTERVILWMLLVYVGYITVGIGFEGFAALSNNGLIPY